MPIPVIAYAAMAAGGVAAANYLRKNPEAREQLAAFASKVGSAGLTAYGVHHELTALAGMDELAAMKRLDVIAPSWVDEEKWNAVEEWFKTLYSDRETSPELKAKMNRLHTYADGVRQQAAKAGETS